VHRKRIGCRSRCAVPDIVRWVRADGAMEYVCLMDEKIRELLQDAFSEAAARDANVAIARARRPDGDDEASPSLRSYEIILSGFGAFANDRSEEHTSELQSPYDLVCRLLLEKKKQTQKHRQQ